MSVRDRPEVAASREGRNLSPEERAWLSNRIDPNWQLAYRLSITRAAACVMCLGTGLALRDKERHGVLTPRPSELYRRLLADFYAKYEDTPCRDCYKGVHAYGVFPRYAIRPAGVHWPVKPEVPKGLAVGSTPTRLTKLFSREPAAAGSPVFREGPIDVRRDNQGIEPVRN